MADATLPVWVEVLERALPSLLGALAGALTAFTLAGRRLREERRSTRIEKFHAALFVLNLQRNFMRNLREQHLMPYRADERRAYAIPHLVAVPPTAAVDVDALAFLLGVGQGELLNQLTLAETQYQTLVALIEARNATHLAIQARAEAAIAGGGSLPADDLEAFRVVAGKSLSAQIEQRTEALYRMVDDGIKFNRELYASAEAAFRRLFPRVKLFQLKELALGGEMPPKP
jgi:hypothetical protein